MKGARRCSCRGVLLGVLGGAVLAALMVGVRAQTYKWTDADGTVQFGDRPPPGASAQRLHPSRGSTADPEGAERLRQMVERAKRPAPEQMPQSEPGSAPAEASPDSGALAERCKQRRKDLDMLGEQLPVYRDAQGNLRVKQRFDTYQGSRSYLEDAERKAEIARLRRDIRRECGDPDDQQAQQEARQEQIRDERCERERARLEAVAKPSARSSDQAIEEARAALAHYCGA